MPDGPPAAGARRAYGASLLRQPQSVGQPLRHLRPPQALATYRPAYGVADPRPENERSAGGNYRHDRRRVRPHTVARRRRPPRILRPRPQPPGLLYGDGRRRLQEGSGLRSHRRSRLESRGESGSYPRPPRHRAPPTRPRSHQADVSLQRPQLPPDRRGRYDRARYSRLMSLAPYLREKIDGSLKAL